MANRSSVSDKWRANLREELDGRTILQYVALHRRSSSSSLDAHHTQEHQSSLRARLAVACLVFLAIGLTAFGCWGTLTSAGGVRFDEEMGVLPLIAIGAGPLVLVFGFLFLPPVGSSTPGQDHDHATEARPIQERW
jgi:hypothetical protein